MDYFVKNVTSETIILCDLNNIALLPDKVTNLLLFANEKDIKASQDYALAVEKGFIQVGAWRPSTYIVKQYNKAPDKEDLSNVGIITLDTISGHPTTCNQEFSIDVTAPLILHDDPLQPLEAATKRYADRVAAEALDSALIADSHIHDGDITIGGDLDVMGILTAYNIVTQMISGVLGTSGNCEIDINCNLDLLNHDIINVGSLYPDDLYVNRIFISQYAQFGSAGSIRDDNGTRLIDFPATVANTVNYISVSNSITGSGPTIESAGLDTNIGLTLSGKGTGNVLIATSDDDSKVCIGNIDPQFTLHIFPRPLDDTAVLIQGRGASGDTASLLFKSSWGVNALYVKGGIIWEDSGQTSARGRLHICVNTTDDSSNAGVGNRKITFDENGNIVICATLTSNSDIILMDSDLEVVDTISTSALSVSRITGVRDTVHPCEISIECNLNLLNNDVSNIGGLSVDTILASGNITAGGIGSFDSLGVGTTAPDVRFHLYGIDSTDYAQIDTGLNFDQVDEPDKCSVVPLEVAGNLVTGDYIYYVNYYTAIGETGCDSSGPRATATTDATHEQVEVTIPTSSDYRVIGRRIFRSKKNGAYSTTYLLVDIADNITTTYTDNIADAALVTYGGYWTINTTNAIVLLNGTQSLVIDEQITALGIGTMSENLSGAGALTLVGYRAGNSLTTGTQNTLIGSNAGRLITTGSSNVGIGSQALERVTGHNNIGIGRIAGYYIGDSNIAIGYGAGFFCDEDDNVFIGHLAGYGVTTGRDTWNNVIIGYKAGYAINNCDNNILIGYQAANSLTTGENNIIIGYDIEAPSNVADGQLNIGNLIFSDGIDGAGTTLCSGNAGIGITAPTGKLHIDQFNAAGARPVLRLDQGDVDDSFIDFIGTSAADQTKSISTVNGDGSVEGPKNFSSSAGWQFEGMIRIEVNSTDYWVPYYSADVD